CLCINLFCVTLTRLPWKRKHYGFVITHFGIITLLFGAMIGSWFGFEAFATLKKGEEPTFRLTQNESVLVVQSPKDQVFYSIPLPVESQKPTEKSPKILSIPDSKLFLKVDAHSPNLERVPDLISSTDADASYGSIIELSSPIAGQKITLPFASPSNEAQTFDFFGMARVIWVKEIPLFLKATSSWSENQMVFQESQPIISNTSGLFSGYPFSLLKDPVQGLQIQFQKPDGKIEKTPLSHQFPQKINLQNATIEASVQGYWPDFEMKDGKPFSKSNAPENPAILVRLQGKEPIDTRPHLVLAPHDEKSLSFVLTRNGKTAASGTLPLHSPVATGLAQWSVEVKKINPKALIQYQIEPREVTTPEAVPGVRVQLLDEKKNPISTQKWMISGETETMALSSTEVIQLAFGLKTKPIDFGVQLNNFVVPRDEGTDTPSGFVSTLWFYDQNHRLSREDHAEMNYPATYPGGLWRSVLGLNYKFSQASWNPQDLGESTLQVLFDPGWPLKWVGSLMISCGIIVMFYFQICYICYHVSI
ncbi:MAG: cytochrome C biogenesis protein ResB, partial [Verrucomicrobiota bacterium]